MTTIRKDTALVDATVDTVDWNQDGWETCAASAFNVVIFTYNQGAAYSDDSGDTFHVMDANGLCSAYGKALSGDQVVVFIPRINQFAWVILTTDQNIVLALASPKEVQESRGTAWVTWLIPSKNFGAKLFDRPSVSAGDNFLYIAVNLQDRGISIPIRLAIDELLARGSVRLIYFIADVDVFWLRATQNTGSTGYFAALTYVKHEDGQQYISNMRVYAWPENSDHIARFDVPISAVPTEEQTVRTPQGDWSSLVSGRGSLQILGLALGGNELWAAWWGNRTVRTPPVGISTLSFPYPHIGVAVVNVATRHLKEQRYIWNPEHAFVFPDLATNSNGDVGLSFCWGGAEHDPQFGVGMLTGRDPSLVPITRAEFSGWR